MTLDPIELQVFTGALRAACEEMGATLIRAARSPNIKERRDCSTALFDARGAMVAQAEHIPVHLGSMPDAVAAVLGEDHSVGLPWVLNDPFAGGTHLPDITVVTPVFAEQPADPHRPGSRPVPHPRSRRGARPHLRSASPPPAPTTPTSAGACRGRCRQTPAPSRRRAS